MDGIPLTGDELDPLNPDTDGDGLWDGLEVGMATPIPGGVSAVEGIAYVGTDGALFRPDGDQGLTTTSPRLPDTDGDLLLDGEEDLNQNGVMDGDGFGTAMDETSPRLADTDLDGADDRMEGGPAGPDTDGDGTIDALDISTTPVDTDGDGLSDDEEALYGTDPTWVDTVVELIRKEITATV